MRTLLLASTLVALTSTPAKVFADEPQQEVNVYNLAVAVNSPLGWIDGNSIGGSVYVGLTDHQVLRANVASYVGNLTTTLAEGLAGSDSASTHKGRITDGGVGWQIYSHERMDGWMLELGPMLRVRDTQQSGDMVPQVTTKTSELAARALVGYSVMMGKRVFLAAAVGVSCGYEWGNEVRKDLVRDAPDVEAAVNRPRVTAEGFIRLGFTFDYETPAASHAAKQPAR